jgi:hypothetical protein
MSGTRRNAALGWLVWKIGSRVAKKKARENRVKLGAAGVVAVALAGGVAAARSGAES